MNIGLRQLRHLIVLAEEGHFGRAAERLALSQPALSRSVKAVEDAYGVALVQRGPAGATLTRTGEEIVRLARPILQSANHLDETLRAQAGGDAGNVFLGIAPLPASLILSEVCTRVLQSRTGVRLYTDVQPNASLYTHLINATYDFIVCSTLALPDVDKVKVTPAGIVPFDIIVRASHPLARRERVTMADLNAYPVIGAHMRPMGRQAEFHADTSFAELGSLSLSCDNYDVLLRVTQNTDSVWMSSRLAARRAIESNELVTLPLDGLDWPDRAEFAIVTLRNASLSPATHAVMDEVIVAMRALSAQAAPQRQRKKRR
jgi:DNA-binding transcriptional LysR family regulator